MSTLMGTPDKVVGQNKKSIAHNFDILSGGNMGILNSMIGQKFGANAAQFNLNNVGPDWMQRQKQLAYAFDQPIGVKKGRPGLGGSILGLAGGIIGGIFGGPLGIQLGMNAGQALGSATQRPQTRIRV